MEDPEQRVMQALKSAPFVVFAKEAPNSLDDFSMDEAFTYFYFSDVMHTFSGLDPSFLTVGRNAKTDFPEDYEAYFADDVDVCKNFAFPRVKLIFEPWRPPLRCAVLATRKTAMRFQDRLYMLGCFAPVDELELGFTEFSTLLPFPERGDLPQPPPAGWYTAAFDQLPNAMVILDDAGEVVVRNQLANDLGELLPLAIRLGQETVKATDLVDPARRYWHLRKVFPGAKRPMRIWLWRFGSQLNAMALCLKPIEADVMERAQVATDVLSK
ncbi:unnamed protein product [Cladocopium goreaui]|uniref:Heat shock protein-like pss1 n=1 Tax=Cladocopium goreaui TaxID=2562237 RepID=A0A9P1BUE4_9DINO|nr:unnamed protein product [Cladocopium goreaui]